MSYLQTALKVVQRNTPEKTEPKIKLIENHKSIEDTIDDIISITMDRIIEIHNGRQYHATDELNAIEDEIDRLYKAVLEGQASLSDFQNACERWFLICKEGLGKRTQN